MKITISVILQIVVFSLAAQGGDVFLRGPQNTLLNGVIDGVVAKDELPLRSAVAYEPIRLADLHWSKRVFSRIDAREKMNHVLFYPFDEFNQDDVPDLPKNATDVFKCKSWLKHQERYSLWTIITMHAMLGDLTLYKPYSSGNPLIENGYQLLYPIGPERRKKDDFFLNFGYRESVSACMTFGSKSVFYTIPDMNDNSNVLQLTKSQNSFDAWVDYLTTTKKNKRGDYVANPGVETFTDDPQYTVYNQLKIMVADPGDKSKLERAWNDAKDGQPLFREGEKDFITSRSITAYNIKEDWFFDKERSVLDKRIICIAPVGRLLLARDSTGKYAYDSLNRYSTFVSMDKDGKLKSWFKGTDGFDLREVTPDDGDIIEKELFWIYFPEFRNVLVNYYVYNSQNDAQWLSFDELFFSREFSAQIYKASDKFDREIEDYRHGVDALYEAEKIKQEIRDWEQDIWNY